MNNNNNNNTCPFCNKLFASRQSLSRHKYKFCKSIPTNINTDDLKFANRKEINKLKEEAKEESKADAEAKVVVTSINNYKFDEYFSHESMQLYKNTLKKYGKPHKAFTVLNRLLGLSKDAKYEWLKDAKFFDDLEKVPIRLIDKRIGTIVIFHEEGKYFVDDGTEFNQIAGKIVSTAVLFGMSALLDPVLEENDTILDEIHDVETNDNTELDINTNTLYEDLDDTFRQIDGVVPSDLPKFYDKISKYKASIPSKAYYKTIAARFLPIDIERLKGMEEVNVTNLSLNLKKSSDENKKIKIT